MQTINISQVEIYGLQQSQTAATFPKTLDVSTAQPNPERFQKLFSAKPSSGHDCATKGVIVQFNLTAPEYFWRQIDRYHFIDHVSSQSKMWSISSFPLEKMCNEKVDQRIIDVLQEKINQGCDKREILSNVPGGLMLTSRMTTNILQLKTIKQQRKSHALPEWREFCQWIDEIFEQVGLKEK